MSPFLLEIGAARKSLGELFDISVATFAEECVAILQDLRECVLDASDWNKEVVQALLRWLHTLKGTTGVMGFRTYAHLIHGVEDYFIALNKAGQFPDKNMLYQLADFSDLAIAVTQLLAQPQSRESDLEEAFGKLNSCQEKIVSPKGSTAGSKATASGHQAADVKERKTELVEAHHSLSHSAYDKIFWTLLYNVELITRGMKPGEEPEAIGENERAIYELTRSRVSSALQVAHKMKRLVQGLSSELNKDVEFTVRGFDNEIDSQLLRSLTEMLTHMLRNSMDHGIESADVRRKRGKPVPASITLDLDVQADRSVVIVSDDGAGINGEVVCKKALEKGLITEAQARAMTNYEKQELIFLPGFSTRDEATEISGRGIGMDAVMTEIKKFGSTLVIDSEVGRGTVFTMEFPAPFVYSHCVIFRYGEQYYSLTLDHVCGFEDDPTTVQYEMGLGSIPGMGESLLVIGLKQLDPHYGRLDRPVILLDLGEVRTIMPVDELMGTRRILVYASERAKGLPPYLNGIAKDPGLGTIFNIDTTPLKRDLNQYIIEEQDEMSINQNDSKDTGFHLFDEEPVAVPPAQVAKAPSKVLTLQLGRNEGENLDHRYLSQLFESPGFMSELMAEIALFAPVEPKHLQLMEEASETIDDILDPIEDAPSGEVTVTMLAIAYCSLKTRWLRYNTQLDIYQSEGPDVLGTLQGKIGVCSIIMKLLETVLPDRVLSRTTQIIEQRVHAVKHIKTVY